MPLVVATQPRQRQLRVVISCCLYVRRAGCRRSTWPHVLIDLGSRTIMAVSFDPGYRIPVSLEIICVVIMRCSVSKVDRGRHGNIRLHGSRELTAGRNADLMPRRVATADHNPTSASYRVPMRSRPRGPAFRPPRRPRDGKHPAPGQLRLSEGPHGTRTRLTAPLLNVEHSLSAPYTRTAVETESAVWSDQLVRQASAERGCHDGRTVESSSSRSTGTPVPGPRPELELPYANPLTLQLRSCSSSRPSTNENA